jgi:hypothetical protein
VVPTGVLALCCHSKDIQQRNMAIAASQEAHLAIRSPRVDRAVFFFSPSMPYSIVEVIQGGRRR